MDESKQLDELLPELRGRGVIENAVLLEVDSKAKLLAFARDPRTARFLLARIGDRTALVDPGKERQLLVALRAMGHLPMTTEEKA